MRVVFSLISLASLVILPGCHCCQVTECYADKIDDFADHCDFKKGFDDCYCERLDPTRWCMNRCCPPCHCPQCQ